MLKEEIPLSCDLCAAMWKASGSTNCWSASDSHPPQPENCPSKIHKDLINDAFSRYIEKGAEEARLAQVATRSSPFSWARSPIHGTSCAKTPRDASSARQALAQMSAPAASGSVIH